MLCALVLTAIVSAPDAGDFWKDNPEEQIASIQKAFKKISQSLAGRDPRVETPTIAGHSVEIATYHRGTNWDLVKVHGSADWHEYFVDIYYADGTPFFVFWREWQGVDVEYNPETGGEAKRERTTERRLYLGKTRVIRALHKEGTFPSGKNTIGKVSNRPVKGAVGDPDFFKLLQELAHRLPRTQAKGTSRMKQDFVWELLASVGAYEVEEK